MQELADLSQHGGRNAVSGVAFILRRARRSQELGDLIRGVEVRPVHVVERPLRPVHAITPLPWIPGDDR